MDQLKYELTTPTVSKRGGILENATRKVRMIFSVMASPNRIDILRILNSKGPLTYSELKSLAGFKSKKESGKFAYHLRKLLRQSLVALNKSERRYTITNLGKLVLSLARQIEERSIVESGKMYVRTSKQTIEEFNSDKIIQSLVREANMPLEMAHKLTEEVENKIYKFPNVYLTSSLIREIVNGILVEHGYEDYRNKLARVGLPIVDLVSVMNSIDNTSESIHDVTSKVSQLVFSELLLNSSLPKDISDLHLSGDINISKNGSWNLLADTIFIDLSNFIKHGLDLKGKSLFLPRINPETDNIVTIFPLLVSSLSTEISREIIITGLVNYISHLNIDSKTLSTHLTNMFILSSLVGNHESNGSTVITIFISIDKHNHEIVLSILNSYRNYIEITPIPRIGLVLSPVDKNNFIHFIDSIVQIICLGGIISFSRDDIRGRDGLVKTGRSTDSDTVIALQSLSINMPRIAYQSNHDETYFRAKLALLLKPTISALAMRKSTIADLIRRNHLPLISRITENMKFGKMYATINLTGTIEAISDILGYKDQKDVREIVTKVMKTATSIIEELKKEHIPDIKIGLTSIKDESGRRLMNIDILKYGKSSISNEILQNNSYTQGVTIKASQLIKSDSNKSIELIDECHEYDKLLNGGMSISIDLDNIESNQIKDLIIDSINMPFVKFVKTVYICGVCGKKLFGSNCEKCTFCTSSNLSPIKP
ncbi:MAG: ArsR family transcriptional regulator [Nitrososphaeraceae archaeon]|nr:ArsR family transcriptional regulator [Nitrososphaeraceae archaeon]